MNKIIHIGYPKTATTWFQENFYPKIDNTIYYGHKEIINDLISEDFNSEKFRAQLYYDSSKQLIISEEYLVGLINFEWKNGYYRKIIAQRLHSMFPEADIIIFLRNQVEFIFSGYIQYIKNGGTKSFNKFFDQIRNPDIPDSEKPISFIFLKYNELINIYNELFGHNKIHLYLYEDFSLAPQSFITEYIQKFNFNTKLSNIDFQSINPILTKRLKRLTRFSNYLHKGEVNDKRYLINFPFILNNKANMIRKLNQSKFKGKPLKVNDILSNEQKQFIQDFYSPANEHLTAYFDTLKLKNYGYI